MVYIVGPTRLRSVAIEGSVGSAFYVGSGSPAICCCHPFIDITVHGNATTDVLASIATVYGVNLNGVRGQTSASLIDAAIDRLEGVRQSLGLQRWVFVGASAAGSLALDYAARCPSSISGLVVTSCRGFAPPGIEPGSIYSRDHPRHDQLVEALEQVQVEHLDAHQERRLVWPLLAERTAVIPSMLARVGEISAERRSAFLRGRRDPIDRAPTVAVPVLVLHGRHDPSVPVDQGIALSDALPKAELVILDRSGHFPLAEEPDRCRFAIERFFRILPKS